MKKLATIVLLFLPALLQAEPAPKQEIGADLIRKYNEALSEQKDAARDVAMQVTMEAKIPKLKKEGKLSALRRISSLGRVTYKLLGFQGDDMVKREVIARYMNAEQEASGPPSPNAKDISITPYNYEFKYKGLNYRDDQQVHVFELKPKQKRVGLFKGELWLDPDTCLPVHEQGRLVKNPSVFVKKMEFVRDYQIKDGIALLKHMQAKTDTRLVGTAELNIDFEKVDTPPADDEAEEANR